MWIKSKTSIKNYIVVHVLLNPGLKTAVMIAYNTFFKKDQWCIYINIRI